MLVLAVDVGTGTQDILRFYNSEKEVRKQPDYDHACSHTGYCGNRLGRRPRKERQ